MAPIEIFSGIRETNFTSLLITHTLIMLLGTRYVDVKVTRSRYKKTEDISAAFLAKQ